MSTAALNTSTLLAKAVHQHAALSANGLKERLFTTLFSGLVYPQIWEDPRVDMEALALGGHSRVVCIASGGCNALSYLAAGADGVDTVDLNRHHIALVKLKITAIARLPDYEVFHRFFADANHRDNPRVFDAFIAPHLDEETLRYWNERNMLGRRIDQFARGFYRRGLLGRFIGLAHAVGRIAGAKPGNILAARSLEEQKLIYERDIRPVFDHGLVRFLLKSPLALFGLGIPPAQFHSLSEHGQRSMAEVVEERVRRLACDFPISDNYYAWQAFGRRYAPGTHDNLPPYLQKRNFHDAAQAGGRLRVHHRSLTEFLATLPGRSRNAYVLLDAQDWMTPDALNHLWREITRTAEDDARIIFRTAGRDPWVFDCLDEPVAAAWRYEKETSLRLTGEDRSAIYGGFHLYTRRG